MEVVEKAGCVFYHTHEQRVRHDRLMATRRDLGFHPCVSADRVLSRVRLLVGKTTEWRTP
jgi:hypothetical protein